MDPRQQATSLFNEFKNFAFKGNVVDLAVGVIIGAAFGRLVESLVKNIIMPIVSLVTPGETGYADWKVEFGDKVIPYGLFISDVLNFLIVALALFFFIVKFLGWLMRNKKEEAAAPAEPPPEQQLLTEIRDLLRQQQNPAAG